MTQTHFGFAKLVVSDLEAAAAFYAGVFELTEQGRVHAAIGGRPIDEILYAATAPGGASFVLVRFGDRDGDPLGDSITGFIAADVDALFARAVAAGASVVQAAQDQPEHGVRVGFLADPEGHLIEVVQLLAAH